MGKCIFCGKPEDDALFVVRGQEDNILLCNECILMLSSIANQAYLNLENEDEHEEKNIDEDDFGFTREEIEYLLSDHELYPEQEKQSEVSENIDRADFNEEKFLKAKHYEDLLAGWVEESKKKDMEAADTETTDTETKDIRITPKEINEVLDQHVIGQDKAKKILSVAVYNHAKRLKDTTGRIKKSNILMVGPSGCGKTLLAQTLANVLDVPFAIADATSLTEAGYVGDDVENILVRLLHAADGDVKKAERGIIYIDEIDKIARKGEGRSITRDVSGEGVQHALLKIIEGAEVSVPAAGGRKHPRGQNVMMNTKDILFICGGAFEGLIEKAEEKKSIGFGVASVPKKKTETLVDVTPDKLVRYGMTPELMGRIPVIVSLNDLKEEDLVRILTEPEYSLVKEYQELLAADGVELIFENEALNEIASIALERNTGARGLRSIMEELMLEVMYEAPTETIDRYVVTKEDVRAKLNLILAA